MGETLGHRVKRGQMCTHDILTAKKQPPNNSLLLHNIPISKVQEVKSFGVALENNLDLSSHANTIALKLTLS